MAPSSVPQCYGFYRRRRRRRRRWERKAQAPDPRMDTPRCFFRRFPLTGYRGQRGSWLRRKRKIKQEKRREMQPSHRRRRGGNS